MTNVYLAPTLPDELPNDPMHWAEAWLAEAAAQTVQRNPSSMTLVTVNDRAQPSARVVLCKAFVADPGYLVFYTNYQSKKVQELTRNSNVAVAFHWDSLGRQIRIEGQAVLSPAEESETYFATRDCGSQIGAWGSDQSMPIDSRQALFAQVRNRAHELGVAVSDSLRPLEGAKQPMIARPPHWGGVRIWADRIELWLEGIDRIHERAAWKRTLTRETDFEFSAGTWAGTRLQP